MTSKREAPPTNLRSLEKRIDNLANELSRPVRRIQRAVANTVVGQMLPPGVVKGGTALKLRVGEAGSRFTPDFDAARASSVTLDDYLNDLGDKLAEGWGGFTGTLSEIDAPEPEGVPEDYVMRPFDIRLAYRSRQLADRSIRARPRRDREHEGPGPPYRRRHRRDLRHTRA